MLAATAAAGVLLLSGCGLSLNGVTSSTKVMALDTEDIESSCSFDLRMFNPSVAQRGVLVVYERGDTDQLYDDFDLEEMAKQDGLSMVFAHECNARSFSDIQPDASKGPARELFAALNQLSTQSGHPELATANVVLFGFSAGGILAATTTNLYPNRVLGSILYAAGSASVDIETLAIPPASIHVPSLIIGNAKDESSGTYRNYNYYERGRAAGAIWAYAAQNDKGHCCSDSTRPLIVPWIDAVMNLRAGPPAPPASTQAHAPLQVSPSAGTVGHFICAPDDTLDPFGNADCSFTHVSIAGAPAAGADSAWLPGRPAATEWLAWTTRGSN